MRYGHLCEPLERVGRQQPRLWLSPDDRGAQGDLRPPKPSGIRRVITAAGGRVNLMVARGAIRPFACPGQTGQGSGLCRLHGARLRKWPTEGASDPHPRSRQQVVAPQIRMPERVQETGCTTNSTQSTKPICIGKYCMVGSSVRFIPGAIVPDYCVAGMGAVVRKQYVETHGLIGGNPGTIIRTLPKDAAYFKRTDGWIGTYIYPLFGMTESEQ